MVADKADAAPEDEQPIEGPNLGVLVRLLGRERAAVTQQVHEAHGDASVDVQDQLQGQRTSVAETRVQTHNKQH